MLMRRKAGRPSGHTDRRSAAGAVGRWFVVICSLVVAGTGCAGPPAPRPSDRSSGAQTLTNAGASSPASLDAAHSVLTTDAATLRRRWILFRAQQLLVAQCMRSHDDTYFVTEPGPEPGTDTSTADSLGDGGHLTYGLWATPRTSAQDNYVGQLGADARSRYEQALTGGPNEQPSLTLPSGLVIRYRDGGCVGQARAQLFGSVQNALLDSLLPQDVNQRFAKVLAESAPYRGALSAWRACVARSGYTYADPADAIDQLQSLLDQGANPDVGTLERAVADADAQCDHQSQLRRVRAQELTAFLHRLPSAQLAALADVYHTRVHALEVAARTGAGG
jgi:hypothetical protein